MEGKLKQANENIEYLVDALIRQETKNYDGCCLIITLFGEDRRSDCEKISCVQCCQETKKRYREMLLKQYLVK